MMQENKTFVLVVATLAGVMLAVIVVLLAGLFTSHVDNKEIFAILGPAFQTIVGCFVGVVGSRLGVKSGP
jgi:hypothetical protein